MAADHRSAVWRLALLGVQRAQRVRRVAVARLRGHGATVAAWSTSPGVA